MELRPYQHEAVQSLWTFFSHSGGNPLISIPTGAGKSLIIGEFIRQVFSFYPNQRVLALSHRKEILQQNVDKLLKLWPTAPVGIYSAGLNRKELRPITFAGIASVWKMADQLGHIDLVIIDECHLVSPKSGTMYDGFIAALKKHNSYVKVIGLSATPFRLGMGMLTEEGGLFTDVCYDISSRNGFNKLIADGYLAPLVPKATKHELDVTNVRIQGGEFVLSDLQAAVDKTAITYHALKEMVEYASDRKCWLIFATGISHTEHIAEMLNNEFGITTAAVHSKLETKERDQRIADFKSGKIRCLTHADLLVTGFDHPDIDCIGMLRPTQSPVLWVQGLGRGCRPAEGKSTCLVLDFAGNTRRLGPINDPVLPKKKGKGGKPGNAPVKVCEMCSTYNHASVLFCVECGFEFHKDAGFGRTADTRQLIAGDIELPQIEWVKVDTVTYGTHKKMDKPDSMKVTYISGGLRMYQEYVCFGHSGFALHKAHDWWRSRYPYTPGTLKSQQWCPVSVKQALEYAPYLKVPTEISVWSGKKYPEITNYKFS